MGFVMAYYLATFAVILITQGTISPVKGQSTIIQGQCTVQGCDNGDPLNSIVAEIQQLRIELFDQLNKQVQSIHELLNASFQEKESQQGIVNMRLKDRCPDEHDIYMKQGQRIHELFNESFQELTSQHGTIMTSLLAWKLANGVCGPASEVCDCSDIKASGQNVSGVYEVCVGYPTDRFCTYTFCDMETANGTSLVFQRRKDGSVNFYRTWADYKQGFGDRNGEFWLGNEMLHLLTSKRNYKLRIDLEDFEGNKRFAEYRTFSIGSSIYNYTLEVGGYSGDAGLPPGHDKCSLPVDPLEEEGDDDIEIGRRFGSRPDSRQEHDRWPRTNSNRAEYSVEFKTTSSKGVIFYVANRDHVDFVGIYINKGFISAAFNCGGGLARAKSTKAYTDGRWHTLVFNRNLKRGTLKIDDGADTVSVTAPGSPRTIEVIAPYYVGGLPSDFSSKGASNLENVSFGFVGCLKNFLQDSRDIGNPSREFALGYCSLSAEIGTFFYTDAGYLIVSDNFTVGLDLDIALEIKPRMLSGVLFSVHNQRKGSEGGDYLVLQMVNGEVIFNMDNGRGDVSAIYTPPAKNQLCDGKWHTIRAQKAKNVVVLEVDKVTAFPGVSDEGASNTKTEDPLYVGGVPEVHRGIRTNDRYVGCIRRLELNKVVQDFSQAEAVGRIKLDSCPIT